jgi:hypothetical protein
MLDLENHYIHDVEPLLESEPLRVTLATPLPCAPPLGAAPAVTMFLASSILKSVDPEPFPPPPTNISLSDLPPMSRSGTSIFTTVIATGCHRRGCNQSDEGAIILLPIVVVLLEAVETHH